MRGTIKRSALTAAMVVTVAAVTSEVALAHGVQGRAETPIPVSAFFWAAAIVLVVSFGALALGWRRPLLTHVPWTPLPPVANAFLRSGALLGVLRALTLLTTLAVLAVALFGSTRLGENLSSVAIFVVWWIALIPLSLLFGDVWRVVNPWVTIAKLAGVPDRTTRRMSPLLGLWPATLLLVIWGWLELVYPTTAEPRLIGACIIGYSALTLTGMWLYGTERWLDRCELFSVYTRVISSLSPWETRSSINGGPAIGIRPPLIGVTRVAGEPAQVAFITALIATISFDGLSGSELWARRDVAGADRLISLGLEPFWAGIVVASIGLIVTIAVISAAYEATAGATSRLGHLRTTARVATDFAYTLIPIAVAYAVAHYFTLFVFQSQDIVRLVSDPFGTGANLFGTADSQIDFQLVSANLIWAVQVGAIVLGHVASLALAHDRALAVAPTHRLALRSQVPMLVLMVMLTVAGLWSLSEGMATI